MAKINRRKFFSGVAAGFAGLGLGKSPVASGSPFASKAPNDDTSQPKIVIYNPLGKTGLKVSNVICGTGSVFSPNVLRYAYDLGVNVFDTAEGYMRGKSEKYVGEAVKGIRDKAIIITKHAYRRPQQIKKAEILKRFDESLKRLNTDYVDIAYLHALSKDDLLTNEEILSAYEQLKKDGKIRFKGYSFHSNLDKMLQSTIKYDFADVILFTYNHVEGEKIEPLIKKVRAKGVGTVAMKTMAGSKQENLKQFINEKTSYAQAAIAWVLANKDIDCAVTTMSSYSHVEDHIGASGKKLDRKDLVLLQEYQKVVANEYCRFNCNACEAACPRNVAISDVMRYSMYFEDYKRERIAMEHYAKLSRGKKPLICGDCAGNCVSACPYGIAVKDKMIRAAEILSA